MEFSNMSKAALAAIFLKLQEAQALFNTLSDVEKDQCLNFHTEGSSLNHCLRWGEQAAEDLLGEAGGPPQKWGVLLEMENKKPYFWRGPADNEAHAEGQAIADATRYGGEQVLEVVKAQCLEEYAVTFTVPCTEVIRGDGLNSIGLNAGDCYVLTDSPLSKRERLNVSDRFNLELINASLEEATEDALNAGCLTLQTAMGVAQGDVASVHFSGPDNVNPIQSALAEYATVELLLKLPD